MESGARSTFSVSCTAYASWCRNPCVGMTRRIAALTHDLLNGLRGRSIYLGDASVGQCQRIEQVACSIALRCLLLARRILLGSLVAACLGPLPLGFLCGVGRRAFRAFRSVWSLRPGFDPERVGRCAGAGGWGCVA